MVTVIMRLIMKDDANGIAFYQCYQDDSKDASFKLGLNLVKHEIISVSIREMNAYISNAALRIYDIFERTQRIPENAIAVWHLN
jgi:hypothetical protein